MRKEKHAEREWKKNKTNMRTRIERVITKSKNITRRKSILKKGYSRRLNLKSVIFMNLYLIESIQ